MMDHDNKYSTYYKLLAEREGKIVRPPLKQASINVIKNGWFYIAFIEIWGIYIWVPFIPDLDICIYMPILLLLCYAVFLVKELKTVKKHMKNGIFEPEEKKKIPLKKFLDGLGQAIGSTKSYIILAVLGQPPWILADYYFGGTSYEYALKVVVTLISVVVIFTQLAHVKARKLLGE